MNKDQVAVDNAQLHDDIENIPSNKSGNTPFSTVLEANMTRRKVMSGSLTVAATSFFAPQASAAWAWRRDWDRKHKKHDLVGFEPVAISDVIDTTMPTISDDYEYDVLIPWGTPIEPGITNEYKGDPLNRPSSAEAALQTGLGHDGMWFFPMDQHHATYFGHKYHRRNDVGMLCINHEYGTNFHALGKSMPESIEDVRLSQNIHGVSVLKLKKRLKNNRWRVVTSANSRRITANSPVAFSGPAAKSELLQNPNGNIALGTVNNCGSGATPWGTYLTCEENFNGYFGANGPFAPTEEQERYGFSENGFFYGWHHFDKRFDLSDEDYVNENNRFGWVVEIDPFDGTQKPVKRTALGRFKHEAVVIAESRNGRIAAYMGDDQRFDYCYKYVSDRAWKDAIVDGESPLDNGSLYVAKFNDDGTGEWMELTIDHPDLAARFDSQAEILIYTRIAADILGATPMDRPEWATTGPDGAVFWACTNNSNREEANAPNPETPNTDGHIIRTYDSDDYLGTSFTWDIYLLASSTRDTEGVFTDPDAIWADQQGRLFIGTDGSQPDGLQDQLVVIDTTQDNPEPKRLLVGVSSDEVTGFTITPDQRTAFVNLQHPGNGSPEATNFPAAYDGTTIPRDCTLVIRRKDGGIIGS